MERKITLVGGIPKPIGGVTTFLHRMIQWAPERLSALLDLYPSEDKLAIPIEHRQLRRPLLDLVKHCLTAPAQTYLFNFSNSRSLLLLALLPKRQNRWGLILHHGQLEPTGIGRLTLPLMKRALRKIDAVGALSDQQTAFYQRLGLNVHTVLPIRSYIPCKRPTQDEINTLLPAVIRQWKAEGKRVFIVSGYPTRIYQHLEVLDTFHSLRASGHEDIRLAAFLYGSDSDGLLDTIRHRMEANKATHLYWETGEATFNAALATADGYIRMNIADSFGIAVADAVGFGTPTIASNVCERYPGAETIQSNDFEGLKTYLLTSKRQSSEHLNNQGENGLCIFLDRLASESKQRHQ